MTIRCKDCCAPILLWAHGWSHGDQAADHDHEARPDDGDPSGVIDLERRPQRHR